MNDTNNTNKYIVIAVGLVAAFFAIVGILYWLGNKTETNNDVVQPPGELKIVQWIHFVPSYDVWFDDYAKKWGDKNNVTVTVTHVELAKVMGNAIAEFDKGEGHDLIELLSPPSRFEASVMDLTDINQEAQKRFGKQVSLCTESSYNRTTKIFYGFCHAWVPDPGNYRKNLWETAGMPNGPVTWADLLNVGTKINKDLGVGMGIGMSKEIDSNMALRNLMWSYDASVQDKNDRVVINSPGTLAAVKYMVQLYKNTMTDEVFSWTAVSNNQALISARASYILNSISAYRTAQETLEKVADDIYFTPALKGPSGIGVASAHVLGVYVIPKFSKNPDIAKKFILDFASNYDQAVYASKLYNFPAFMSTVPKLLESGGWLDADPFASRPANKLQILKNAEDWSVNVGYPGSANAANGEVFDTFIIPDMFANAASGKMTPQESIKDAEKKINDIFAKWREKGLISQ